MSAVAILLIIVSAVIHAGWNLLGKKEHPSTAFFLAANTMGFLLLTPFMIMHHEILLHAILPRVWRLLIISGLSMTVYYVGLAGAYRRGDMSLAYPLARSSPVIVVMVVTIFLGRIDQVSAQCIAGVCLVVGGCFLLPMTGFGEFRLKNYLNRTCLLAFIAAWGTTGYSISDDEALRLLRESPIQLSTVQITFLYLGLEAGVASICMLLFIIFRRNGRRDLMRVFGARWRQNLCRLLTRPDCSGLC